MDSSRKKVFGAFGVGLLMVISALAIRINSQTETDSNNTLAVVTGSQAPREIIAVSDKDNDGIPDWQEALQRTEPVVIEETKSNYEIPDTLTDQFSIEFFQDFVRAQGQGDFGNTNDVIEKALDSLPAEAQDDFYDRSDIIVHNDNSSAAIKSYLVNLAKATIDNTPTDQEDELMIFERVMQSNDKTELDKLDPILETKVKIISASKNVAVPSTFANLHVDYLNTLNAEYNDLLGMKKAYSDPLYAFLRAKRYEEDIAAIQIVILEIDKLALDNGVVIQANDL